LRRVSFGKLPKFRIRDYDSVRMLREGISSHFSRRLDAADTLESLAERVDKMSEDEFEVFRKEIPNLVMTNRACISGIVISGGLTSEQHAMIKSRAEVKSHLLYSAGYCRHSIRDYGKAQSLLMQALNLRPKPKTYNFREVKSDPSNLGVEVTGKQVKLESVHVFPIVSRDQIEGEADEVVSFRDAEFFGTTYLWLAKAFLYGQGQKTAEDFTNTEKCLDAAHWYLEKTRHFDLNIILRGVCCYDKGMCSYYQAKFKEAIPCFDQALFIYERAKSFSNLELGIADCLLYRGECKLRLGNQEAAVTDLKKALDLSSRINQRDNVQRALSLLRRGDEIAGKETLLRRRVADLGGGKLTRGQIVDLGKGICPMCGKNMTPNKTVSDNSQRWFCPHCRNFFVLRSNNE
jgi:tetratricopeptide (TPR) repeat protein